MGSPSATSGPRSEWVTSVGRSSESEIGKTELGIAGYPASHCWSVPATTGSGCTCWESVSIGFSIPSPSASGFSTAAGISKLGDGKSAASGLCGLEALIGSNSVYGSSSMSSSMNCRGCLGLTGWGLAAGAEGGPRNDNKRLRWRTRSLPSLSWTL